MIRAVVMAHLLGANNSSLMRAPGVAGAQPTTKLSAQPETKHATSAARWDTLQLCVGVPRRSGMSEQAQMLRKMRPSWALSQTRAVVQTGPSS